MDLFGPKIASQKIIVFLGGELLKHDVVDACNFAGDRNSSKSTQLAAIFGDCRVKRP